ncbi:MAG: hypothetical protein HYW24_02620 [Candidatus Aenigmarchaeota archaeon]|nr:hypothetical protein [Candidatus Aenigmarchaeota archaeon]
MEKPEILLIDTTNLYSGVIYHGVEHKILKSGKFLFLTTDVNMGEIARVIKRNLDWDDEKIKELIANTPVITIPSSVYSTKLFEANDLIGKRDPKDVPLVALALRIENDGIFSSDTDFEVVKDRFRIWKGSELLKFVGEKS